MNVQIFHLLRSTVLAIALTWAMATPSFAQDRPLLVEGKSTVYQRVLTRTDVAALDGPDGAQVSTLPTFTPMYVYERTGGWLRVGQSATGGTVWVPEGDTVIWTQNIVAAFHNPGVRGRQLLMESEDALVDLMNQENVRAMKEALLEEADARNLRDGSGVNSVEPTEHVDIRQQFYVMPILGYTEDFHPLSYQENLLLNVASIPEDDGAEDESELFEVGIVFVLDTTQSMGPYIQRTKNMLGKIIADLRASEVGKRMHFGAIAFRDNPQAADGLGYRSKTIIPLERRADHSVVADAIGNTQEATVSSPGFNEDSFAGVLHALDETDWAPNNNGFGARYVILVTDAGPKTPGDPNALDAETARDAATLQQHAAEKGIAVLTLHLKTQAGGAGNHGYAQRQYSRLSSWGGGTYYYGIDQGSAESFQAKADSIVRDLAGAVQSDIANATPERPGEGASELEQLGYAMRLAWLGRTQGTQAPDVISSWVSQYDVEEGINLAFAPRLLVTKNELATIADIVREFIELGEEIESVEDAQQFHTDIRRVILRMAQNPDRLVNPQAEGLGDAMEFLEDLPYRSQILRIDENRWLENAMQRRSVLDNLKPKLAQYRAWLSSADVWTALHEDAPDGELVYAMPFQLLP